MASTVYQTNLPLPLIARGKVRDVYDLGDRLLIVATDRLSAFDVVLPTPIPHKGDVTTQISRFWFELAAALGPNHCLDGTDADLPPDAAARPELRLRSIVVRRTKPFLVECVVRGYLSGSAWAEYRKTPARDGIVSLWGLHLPSGLRESDRLPEPVFSPATKAASGHDLNISFADCVDAVGGDVAAVLRDRSLAIYASGSAHAESRGLILADTKFEFGEHDGRILLIDELMTPDSSRFWDAVRYQPGRPQASFDKQFVRDWLQALTDAGGWNKEAPGPDLPPDVLRGTSDRYLEAYRRVTGRADLGAGSG